MAPPLLVALALEGLAIRTNTPLALCPTVEAVEQAVAERLRVVENDGQRWELVLENAHRAEPPAADLLHVQLFDGTGALRTDQELDVSGADCNVRAQTVALLVADQFEAMRLQAPPAPLDTEKPPPISLDREESEPPAQKPAPTLSLGVGAGVSEAWSPGAALRASIHAARLLEVSALMLAPVKSEENLAFGGKAEAWSFPLRLSAGLAFRGRRADFWIGPELLAEYERATTRGIAEGRTNRRAIWGIGAQVGVRVHGNGPWGAYLVLASDYALPVDGSRFEIDGVEVLEPGPLLGGAALGVDYDFF
jgi:hypothetical protein